MKKTKYIKGNKKHSSEIENYFVSQGAELTRQYSYDVESFAYFVNPDTGCVNGYSVDSWEFKALSEAGIFEELKYPYTDGKPKLKVIQGDPRRGDEVVALLESLGGKNTELPEKSKLQVVRGDSDRGSEVIALLESIGGINKHGYDGDDEGCYYFIDPEKTINYFEYKKTRLFHCYDLEVLPLPVKEESPNEPETAKFKPFVSKVLVRSNTGSR